MHFLRILSYAGDVTVGVVCDAAIVPDPDALVADLHAEFAALQARVRAVARGAAGAPGAVPSG